MYSTIYVLIDNSQHESEVVGAFLSRESALSAWESYCEAQDWFDAEDERYNDERCEYFSIQQTTLESK